jgi:hypothetical protein
MRLPVVSLIVVMASLSGLSVTAQTIDTCTSRERAELKREGWTIAEIREYCRGSDGDEDLPRQAPQVQRRFPRQGSGAATICVTQWGACPMAVPILSGSQCVCYTYNGPVPGLAR